jgi:hypothetical protein
MSAFKLFLIIGGVVILFLPALIRRSSGLPAAFEQLRARIAGEHPPEDQDPAEPPNAISPGTKPGPGERLGRALARLSVRLRPRAR